MPCPPVLLIVFRRPEMTRRVLERIREAAPPVLLVAADAPAREADHPRCQEVRRCIEKGIDWPCEVRTRFLERHLGCKYAVSSAIDWAFGQCAELIILEDDCVPRAEFFRFCGEMLTRYAADEAVMQVCGSNLTGARREGEDYHFSRLGPIWGWASWRRAWAAYDVEMGAWPQARKDGQLRRWCPEPFEAAWREEIFDAVHAGKIDTWDYQWAFAKLARGGLNVVPARHLVENIGFGPDATHTRDAADPRGRLTTGSLDFPLRHPEATETWREGDQAYLRQVVGLPARSWSLGGWRYRIKRWARKARQLAQS